MYSEILAALENAATSPQTRDGLEIYQNISDALLTKAKAGELQAIDLLMEAGRKRDFTTHNSDLIGGLREELYADALTATDAPGIPNHRRLANRLVREAVEGTNAVEAASLILSLLSS